MYCSVLLPIHALVGKISAIQGWSKTQSKRIVLERDPDITLAGEVLKKHWHKQLKGMACVDGIFCWNVKPWIREKKYYITGHIILSPFLTALTTNQRHSAFEWESFTLTPSCRNVWWTIAKWIFHRCPGGLQTCFHRSSELISKRLIAENILLVHEIPGWMLSASLQTSLVVYNEEKDLALWVLIE